MTGRHRDEPADTRLDDLFGEVESPRPVRRASRWVLLGLLQTFVVTIVMYTLIRLIGLDPPFLLVLAVGGGVVLVRLAAVSVRPPRGHRPARFGATRPAEPPARADGVLVAIRRWDRRLANTDSGLSESLGELADERLRQRHGITRASDPDRARALLGEPVWALLGVGSDRTARGAVTPAQAETAIRRLESM